MGRNQHSLVGNRQLKENSVIRLLQHNLVKFAVNKKIMSVVQLELVCSDVVQRLYHPVRLGKNRNRFLCKASGRQHNQAKK